MIRFLLMLITVYFCHTIQRRYDADGRNNIV